MTRTDDRRGRPRSQGAHQCDRCRRSTTKIVARWPEGAICYSCYSSATRTHGTCPGCASRRMLPGRNADGDAVCVDCAGIPLDLHCHRCGHEEERYRAGLCARCALRDDLHTVLCPTNDAEDPRRLLLEALASAARPQSVLTWMRGTQAAALLHVIGAGEVELSHSDLDLLPAGRAVEHLRALAVHHGLLPERDPHLARFERWLGTVLVRRGEQLGHHQLTSFARWHHLRRVRRLPAHRTAAAVRSAKQEITVAAAFLDYLSSQNVDLDSVSQRHIDSWLAPGPTTRYHARTFVVWAVRNRHLPRAIEFPHRRAQTQPTMDDQRRLELIRRCLHDDHIALNTRVAGILLLVYAQPLVRIAALRCDDVVVDPDTGLTLIRLGEPATPVPEPFASVLHQQRNNRFNLNTGTTDSPWLFPSTRAGQHLRPGTILDKLHALGIDRKAARVAALEHLVTRTPPTVVATMLGYSYQVTERYAAKAGENYAGYPTLLGE
ncbi:recombinase XerD (plasmid) [Rhodococcus pyridinivorans]|uniref:recombinase XerD n=1 Tax=Rhodococcus pyridinivorans TaxID=103816 RepID=UPI0020C66D9D|nr:recombinase XerD [Rhodococcus pyridinivorans]UTM39686.1 recombinase XerD [Rhodococcus pyridinivorans]